MFDSTSRYYSIETATYTTSDGEDVTYVRRRFLPKAEDMQALLVATVTDEDRLDLITARTLGAPGQFWRIADANNAMNPFDLTDEPGRELDVPAPQMQP